MKLGDKVHFTQRLSKVRLWKARHVMVTEWDTVRLEGEGVIMGIRTLAEGVTLHPFDGHGVFEPRRRFKAYMVVTNINQNPIYVPMDSVYPAPGLSGWPS